MAAMFIVRALDQKVIIGYEPGCFAQLVVGPAAHRAVCLARDRPAAGRGEGKKASASAVRTYSSQPCSPGTWAIPFPAAAEHWDW